ncbi:MAG: hypothetical protein JXR37_31955 [Kiritimatiellae bacterium]|nr:hypothetical protein [Kiritimatiellia bacterium]
MYRQFYSWPNILSRRPVAAAQLKAYLEFNLLYRKYGKATCRLGKWFGMRNLAKLAKHVAYPERRRPSPTPAPSAPRPERNLIENLRPEADQPLAELGNLA